MIVFLAMQLTSALVILMSSVSHWLNLRELRDSLEAHQVLPALMSTAVALSLAESALGLGVVSTSRSQGSRTLLIFSIGVACLALGFLWYLKSASSKVEDASVPCSCGFGGSVGTEALLRAAFLFSLAGLGSTGALLVAAGLATNLEVSNSELLVMVVSCAPIATLVHLVPVAMERYRVTHNELARAFRARHPIRLMSWP